MDICIYCDASAENLSDEHVMPQMFGTFEDNFVIHDVCENCNNSFSGRELSFGRDSGEALLRLQHGVKPESEADEIARKRAAPRVVAEGFAKGAKMLMRGGDEGKMAYFPPQVGFFPLEGSRKLAGDPVWFDEIEITLERVAPYKQGHAVSVVADSDEAIQRLDELLYSLGFERGGAKEFSTPGVQLEGGLNRVDVETSYEVGQDVLRTVAKIAFNYLAFFTDAQFVKGRDFDEIRAFIRHGTSPPWNPVILSKTPLLYGDEERLKQTDAHIITVEWIQRKDGLALLANVAFFNSFTYKVLLCKTFSALWRPVKHGHAFDHRQRRITSLSMASSCLAL